MDNMVIVFFLLFVQLSGRRARCLFEIVAANTVECSNSLVPVTVTRKYRENAQEEWMSLWKGEPSSGELLLMESGAGYDQKRVEQTLCVDEGFYSLRLSSLYFLLFLSTLARQLAGPLGRV